jgi:hypothetical protein
MSKARHTLKWYLHDWMRHRGIQSFAAFARRIGEQGHSVSSAHVARLMQTPELLSLPMLDAVCRVLDCTPGELLRTASQPHPIVKPRPTTTLELPKPSPPRLPEDVRRQVVGPPIRALHARTSTRPKLKSED